MTASNSSSKATYRLIEGNLCHKINFKNELSQFDTIHHKIPTVIMGVDKATDIVNLLQYASAGRRHYES